MSWIGQTQWVATQVWAQNNVRLSRAQSRDLDAYVSGAISRYGIPRAAACVSMAWSSAGRRPPSLPTLAHLLSKSYAEHSGTMRRGWSADVINNWRK
ncbi:hypothetical protein SAMN04489867_3039 [Pedococcus dokdonensis]|uniref:Uncharacterized protein n=1 Tax=Pedococcus dokdonensis TaxID=443156 RepID=A0A1H0TYK6_9MICO|nr:hypothetical protein SAMN04489867_3039 [Pedococcus dokdonensis]